MNLVGKIFTVVILVMSLVFMSLALAVYATHRNWREMVMNEEAGPGRELGLRKQLENEKAVNLKLTDDKTKLETDITTERTALRERLKSLETELDTLRRENEGLTKAQTDLQKSEREAVAAMQATQNTLASLRKEVDGIRDEIHKAREDRDKNFKEVVRLTDELHQKTVEVKRLEQRNTQLAEDLGRAKNVLLLHNLDANADYSSTPPKLDGLVVDTGPTADLLTISLGSDDGLRVGHRLDVYRQNSPNPYLGRVEVIRLDKERAVCRVDPNYRKGQIQKGDRVATKLQ